ncbi:MAG: 4Fe-4S dicluster domain-containing protein [Pseudomonadota bacterium]|nr:4Fe-4S dicluster domain-containing protein [Pseudomonadota bacterium]
MKENNSSTHNRRNFLKTTATVAGITVAPGILLHSFPAQAKLADQAVTTETRWGMLININQCQNCDKCVQACADEHGIKAAKTPETTAKWIRKVQVRNQLTQNEYSLPLLCQHCEHPPCADVCPTGASFKRADGIVLVDKHICIGCRYCMMACPYKARSFVHEALTEQKPYSPRGKGTVESCTFCVHRVDLGIPPACVEACQQDGNKAMIFGDIKDPYSNISKKLSEIRSTSLRDNLQLNPGVRYQGI